MTIEESINILKQYVDYNNPDIPDFYTMEEAIKVIIEALEQEPCEDVVNRQDVEDAIYDYSRSCDVNYAQIMEFIDKLPSVTPQPKMGQWKRINKEKYVQHAMSYYRCSECGKEIIGTHNYCPNCGRKMKEVEG